MSEKNNKEAQSVQLVQPVQSQSSNTKLRVAISVGTKLNKLKVISKGQDQDLLFAQFEDCEVSPENQFYDLIWGVDSNNISTAAARLTTERNMKLMDNLKEGDYVSAIVDRISAFPPPPTYFLKKIRIINIDTKEKPKSKHDNGIVEIVKDESFILTAEMVDSLFQKKPLN